MIGGFETVDFLLLPFYRLPQFRYLYVIGEIVGSEGVRQALGDLLNMLVVLRVCACGSTKHVDGVDVIGVVLIHDNRLLGNLSRI